MMNDKFTFELPVLDEVKATMMGEEYTLPAVKHPHIDAPTTLLAIIIKLHQRVQVLEAELTGSVAANGGAKGGKND